MNDFPFFVAKKSQVTRFSFMVKVDRFSMGNLLRSIPGKFVTTYAKNNLG